MSPAVVIAFDEVSKRYGAAGPVLDGVSLQVREREFLAIVGPSGSGKTTLLRLVNRLIDPTEGTVRVEGDDVQSIDAVTLRRRIGYVFQGVGLFPHMTVAENIAITPKLLGWDDTRMAQRVDTLLDLVRLGCRSPPPPFTICSVSIAKSIATASRLSFPAAKASASASPAPSPPSPASS